MKEEKKGIFSNILSSLLDPFSSEVSTIVFEADSEYSHIAVMEKSGIRTLYLGPMSAEAETSIKIDEPDAPVFEYPGLMFLSLAICPLNTNILLVGLGGGYIPRLFQNYLPTKNLTVAEIDPMVVDVCSSFFFFKPGKNVKLVVSDGLQYIASSPEAHFDQIWMDAFNGEYIPEHLATEEFLEICKLHLKPGGLLVQNLHMTKQERYRSQLILTNKVFQELPLVFNGFRCANSVIMSFNSPSGKNIVTEKLIKKRIQEFIPNVGPYNLHKEADKITRFPTLPREK